MWMVCELKTKRDRTSAIQISPSTVVPVPVDSMGKHKTRNEAVRSLVLTFHPELSNSPIEHLKRVSLYFISGGMRTHKIINFR